MKIDEFLKSQRLKVGSGLNDERRKLIKELTNDSNGETCNKKSNKNFKELDNLCFLSKNLYNSALYSIRQSYFETKEYTNYYAVVSKFTKENQVDYRSLPSKVSQQTLKMVDQNFKSFFACLKRKNVEKVKIPKYLEKDGRFVVTYTNQAISKKMLKEGIIKLSGSNVELKTKVENVRQVRVVPRKEYIVVEVLYETTDVEKLSDSGRYCSIYLWHDICCIAITNI